MAGAPSPSLSHRSHLRIGLIADTHVPSIAKQLPEQIFVAFTGVDLILHAGDLVTLAPLQALEAVAPVLAVRGNRDLPYPETAILPSERKLELAGHSLVLTHQCPRKPKEWEQRYPTRPEILVCGHSHRVRCEQVGPTLVLNPGSPVFPEQRRRLGTVAILSLAPDSVHFEPIDLASLAAASPSAH